MLASSTIFHQVQQILGWSELHLAAMEGETLRIKELVHSGSTDLHVPSANSWTPLHYAAAYSQVRHSALQLWQSGHFVTFSGDDKAANHLYLLYENVEQWIICVEDCTLY